MSDANLKDFHYILDSSKEELCDICRKPARHKIEEVMDVFDKPGQIVRHPFTAYLCCEHFYNIMGSLAKKTCDDWWWDEHNRFLGI